MATLNDPEHLENEINTPNPREGCGYYKQLDYTLDADETIISFDITENILPHNLVLDNDIGEISGTVISPDDWDTEISNYLLEEYDNMEDWETPFPGSPELTIGDLKELEELHISGINYGIMGMKAYHRDGNTAKYYFTVTLTTDSLTLGEREVSKPFYIQITPNIDPKVFINSYGNTHNNLKDDDMNILSPEDYLLWRESQGHVFLSGCTY